MSLQPEDIDIMRFPPIMVFLFQVQTERLSFDWKYKDEMLHSVPVPPDYLNEKIQKFYDELRALQPGFCDECGEWWPKRVQGYWGARPLFCVPCWRFRLKRYQLSGQWPQAEFPE